MSPRGSSADVDTRRRRSPQETRRAILDAATAFLREHPFREMAVARVMESTHVGRSAFYVHFNDVYECVEATLLEFQGDLVRAAEEWLKGRDQGAESLVIALRRLVDLWIRFGPVLRGAHDAAAHDARMEQAWRRLSLHFYRLTQKAIEREQAAGRIPPMDARETAIALVEFNVGYLNERLGGSKPGSQPELITETVQRLWLGTLYGSTPPLPHTTSPSTSRRV